MEQTSLASADAPQAPTKTPLARIARWQRAALCVAGAGAATIGACAFLLSRPLPVVAPPPSGIAPLLLSNTAQASASNANPAPATISGPDYLSFLKQIDQQRQAMLTLLDSGIASTGQVTPAQGASNSASLNQSAQSLQTAFQTQAAPVECSSLASAYSKLLQDQCSLAAQASPLIASGDTRSASALQISMQKQIEADAAGADEALTQTSAALQSPKPFAILADPAQSPAAAPVGVPTAAPQQPQASQPAPENAAVTTIPIVPVQPGETGQPARTNQYAPAANTAPPPPAAPQATGNPTVPGSAPAAAANPTPAP